MIELIVAIIYINMMSSVYQRNKRKLGIKSTAKAFIKALFWPVLLLKACLRSVETFIAKYN